MNAPIVSANSAIMVAAALIIAGMVLRPGAADPEPADIFQKKTVADGAR